MKVRRSTIWYFALLMPCFKPTFFSNVEIISKLYTYYTLLIGVISVFLLLRIVLAKPSSVSRGSLLVLVYQTVLLVSTIINKADLKGMLINYATVAAIIYVLTLLKDDWYRLVNILMVHLELGIYINFLTIILFPERLYGNYSAAYGVTHEWFLGGSYTFWSWFIPGITVALIYFLQNRRKVRRFRAYGIIAAIILSLLRILIHGGAVSVTSLVVILLLLVLSMIPGIEKFITPFRAFVGYIGAFYVMVILRNIGVFRWLIVDVFGKDLTLTMRTLIWDNALIEILKSPIIGRGQMSGVNIASVLGYSGATHCHNEILQVLLFGGGVLLTVFLLIQIVLLLEMQSYWNDKIMHVLCYMILVFNIMGITEVTNSLTYFLMLALVSNYYSYKKQVLM